MKKIIVCNPILYDWIWEFSLIKAGQPELKLVKTYHVNSTTFSDVEIIDQWDFIIPESEIICSDRTKLVKIRNNEITDYKALMIDQHVVIE